MTPRPPRTPSLLLAAVLICPPAAALAKDKWDPPQQKASGAADSKAPAAKELKDKSSGSKDASASAASKAKLYRFKGEKKPSGSSTAQPVTLLVEDVFTGRSESLQVGAEDPAAKEYAPRAAVTAALADLEPGAVIELETEKQKGRSVVTSLSKAEYKPGEEQPNGFVFVSSEAEEKGGVEQVVVTLSKFGREVKVGVPMVKDDDNRDAKREPDPKIDYVVRRLQSGTVVEAQIKSGKVPMLAEIFEYRKPERGKFVGLKQVEFNSWPAAGFEMSADDGTTITFTLEGTEQSRNGQTMYAPNPQQLAAVRKLKKDAPIEVHYKLDGRAWILRRITLLNANEKPADKSAAKSSGKSGGDDNMKDDKDMKAAGGDADKPEKGAEKPKAEKS